MSLNFLLHLAYLFLTVTLTWAWTQSPALSFYNLQVIAALIIVWFLKNHLAKKKALAYKSIDALIFTIVILLLVFSTGGADSPLFFLVYFLFFGLSFLFEPAITITLAFILLAFLAPTVENVKQIVNLLSLFLVTPLALFFGQLYLNNLTAEKKIKMYQKNWLENEKHLEKMETSALLWLATKLKPNLEEALDRTSQLLADISKLTPWQKAHLKRLRKITRHLLKGEEKLARSIDTETEKK